MQILWQIGFFLSIVAQKLQNVHAQKLAIDAVQYEIMPSFFLYHLWQFQINAPG